VELQRNPTSGFTPSIARNSSPRFRPPGFERSRGLSISPQWRDFQTRILERRKNAFCHLLSRLWIERMRIVIPAIANCRGDDGIDLMRICHGVIPFTCPGLGWPEAQLPATAIISVFKFRHCLQRFFRRVQYHMVWIPIDRVGGRGFLIFALGSRTASGPRGSITRLFILRFLVNDLFVLCDWLRTAVSQGWRRGSNRTLSRGVPLS
jgi:hypothetical protein